MMFSVIVPFLNEEKYIDACIQAIGDQDFDRNEYELIFVDNGSTDRSKKIVEKYPAITLLEELDGADFACRNKALEIAKGEIIAFTDADCAPHRNWLSEITKGMRSSKAGIAVGKHIYPEPLSDLFHVMECCENEFIAYLIRNKHTPYFYAYTNNMIVRHDVFRKLGPFRKKPLAGDTDLVHRYMEKWSDPKMEFFPEVKITHLEIDSLLTVLNKTTYYAYMNKCAQYTCSRRETDLLTRFKIYKSCIQNYRFNLRQTFLMIFFLILNALFHFKGKAKGYLHLKFGMFD